MELKYKTVGKVLEALLEELERWHRLGVKIQNIRFQVSDLVRVTEEEPYEEEVGKKTIYHVLKMLERAGYVERCGKRWKLSQRVIDLFFESP